MSNASVNRNILLIVGSPKNKKGNSEALIDYLQSHIGDTQNVMKISLRREMKQPDILLKLINQADDIVISYPVYQNSFPGLVLQLFEFLINNKGSFDEKERKMIAISNSGFPEIEANTCSVEQCKLFAEQMGFTWEYGIIVAPGAMIGGNDLDKAGNIYKKIRAILENTAHQINTDNFSQLDENRVHIKSLFNPSIYRVAGRILQNKLIKQLGKEKYYQTPLC